MFLAKFCTCDLTKQKKSIHISVYIFLNSLCPNVLFPYFSEEAHTQRTCKIELVFSVVIIVCVFFVGNEKREVNNGMQSDILALIFDVGRFFICFDSYQRCKQVCVFLCYKHVQWRHRMIHVEFLLTPSKVQLH